MFVEFVQIMWQLSKKQVYSTLAVVSLVMMLQSSVVAQVETVVREVETVVMQSGQTEVVTSQGVVIRVDNRYKALNAPISIDVEEITYDDLPVEIAAMLDPSFSKEGEGIWKALPLKLYRISLMVVNDVASAFPVLRVYLPTKEILRSDSVYSGYFMRTEYLPPSITMCATPEGLTPCERLSLWFLAERYSDVVATLPAGIIRYGADNYVGIFDQNPIVFSQDHEHTP